MNFTFKQGAFAVAIITLGVALGVVAGFKLNEVVNKAKMPPPATK